MKRNARFLLATLFVFGTLALPSVQQHIKSGALPAIGVAAAKRVAPAPDIPTRDRSGLGDQVTNLTGTKSATVTVPHDQGNR